MTHTPGPWKLGGKRREDRWYGGIVGADNATVLTSGKFDGLCADKPSVLAANARLIAAAPDLLAACKAMVGHLAATFPPYGPGESPHDKMRAAIAKATGE